jgi:hypothetical protein
MHENLTVKLGLKLPAYSGVNQDVEKRIDQSASFISPHAIQRLAGPSDYLTVRICPISQSRIIGCSPATASIDTIIIELTYASQRAI